VAKSDTDDVKRLQVLRLKLLRIDPPRPIRNLRAALALIKERRIVLSTGRSSLPMLGEAIAGRALRGSWMANPEVYRIYELLKRINEHSDVLSLPLVLGKDTIIHTSLGPAVARVADDSNRREKMVVSLPPVARRLLQDVERTGMVRMDRWAGSTKEGREARLRLARELLVFSREFHTERGHHAAAVVPWSQSELARRFKVRGNRMLYEDAVDEMILAAVHSAVLVPEREARRWFVFGEDQIDALLRRGSLVRIRVGKVTWLTPQIAGRVRTS